MISKLYKFLDENGAHDENVCNTVPENGKGNFFFWAWWMIRTLLGTFCP